MRISGDVTTGYTQGMEQTSQLILGKHGPLRIEPAQVDVKLPVRERRPAPMAPPGHEGRLARARHARHSDDHAGANTPELFTGHLNTGEPVKFG
jgi:hypothetical protein